MCTNRDGCIEHRFVCWSEWLEADYLFIVLAAEDETLPRYVLVSAFIISVSLIYVSSAIVV